MQKIDLTDMVKNANIKRNFDTTTNGFLELRPLTKRNTKLYVLVRRNNRLYRLLVYLNSNIFLLYF